MTEQPEQPEQEQEPEPDPEQDVTDVQDTGQVVSLADARARHVALPEVVAGELAEPMVDEPELERPAIDGIVVAHPTAAQRWSGAQRRQLIPDWLRDRRTATQAARWASVHYAHTAVFHGLRLPLYGGRLLWLSPAGVWRITRTTCVWALDPESRTVRSTVSSLKDKGDANVFMQLTEQRRSIVRGRLVMVGVGFLALAMAGMVAVESLTRATLALTAAVAVVALGLAGRRPDRPLTRRAVDSNAIPKLTSELILTALASLGIGELNKAMAKGGPTAVGFPSPITRDGPGWRADIDLPPGVTAGDVIERRDRVASGLRRPLGCVWPEPDADSHEGRLVLWVGDRSLSSSKPTPWPLTKAGKANVFEPVTIGVDQRGRPVQVTLMYASGIIGAIPRMGKTFLLRLLLLIAALDPRCEIHVFDLKGGADMSPLEGVAHAYRTGDDREDIEYIVRDLRDLHADMQARYKTVRHLPKDVCPESKVTDALASRPELGLHPVIVAMDECGIAFQDPTHGAEIADLSERLGKRGPAVGIMVWNATQRPDAKSLPTGISANAVLRLCLKVMGQIENDMVLGTSSYKAGIRATMFARSDRGIALLAGEGDDPVVVRISYVDTPTATTIVARARAARELAGLLTGHAAGADPDVDRDRSSILDHLIKVWPAGEDQLWCADLAVRLAEAVPETYGGWSGEQVTAAVKPHGLRSGQIKRMVDGRYVNRRGLTRVDLVAALRERDELPEVF